MISFQEQVQLMVMPKFFHCQKFSYKSDYSIRIEFIYESENGKKFWACPFIIKGPEMIANCRIEKKQPKMIIENKKGIYQTEQFHVQFEDDSYTFREMCIFKHQINGKRKSKGSAYLDITLLSYRNTVKQANKNFSVKKTCRQIETKRLIVNRNYQELGEFYRLTFSDNDYFSNLSLYVGSAHLGWKIRKNKLILCEFLSLEGEERKKLMQNISQEKVSESDKCGKLIKNTIKLYCDRIELYFDMTLVKAILQNIRLIQMFEQMKQKLGYEDEPRFKVKVQNIQKIQSNYNSYLSLTGDLGGLIEHYDTENINQLYFLIYQEAELICQFNHWIWQVFSTMMLSADITMLRKVAQDQFRVRQERFFTLVSDSGVVEDDLNSRTMRVQSYKLNRTNYLRKMTLYDSGEQKHPFVMFQTQNSLHIRKSTSLSLVIMVHGYQGNSQDLQKAGNYIKRYNKNCEVIQIHSLQSQPESSIKHAAEIVADQIKHHISTTPVIYNYINIIGYSVGGVIARAALQHLREYKDRFKLLITFSSPHLGLTSSENSLVRMGIWFMIKFQKAAMIGDMNGAEEGSCCKSYMKVLSECRNLGWFQKIVLVGSRQDQFIPHCSSTIKSSPIDSQTSQLVQNISLNVRKMQRVQVWFDIEDEAGRLDKMTGRKAHIEFLDNDKFLNTFFQIYAHQL